ncbi:MAG: carboxypeptidase-like regulatory domain-containing protein [Longimicrobiales bacterium]|nr:carboxypeptidase-like regulatory domain-containing protein [Longimicrobiales bacterium]
MSRFNRSRIIAVAYAFLAVPAGAQTLRGTIVDSDSGEPVVLAYVGLLAEGQEMVVAALANMVGEFEVTAPSAGGYFLYVSRTGYETLMDGVFDLGEGGEFNLQVGLRPAPIELEEVVVESSTRSLSSLEQNGFYDRAIMGLGTLMIRDEIERRAIDKVSDVFRMIPRLEIDDSRPLTGSTDVMRNPAIYNWRGGRKCSPTLYIDRHVVNAGGDYPLRPDDYMTASEIEAIEVYTRTSEVPVGFDEITSCGVILVWTRTR